MLMPHGAIAGALLFACLGGCGDGDAPSAKATPQASARSVTKLAASDTAYSERAFTPAADRLVLLPFDVRLNRVAEVTGVASTDAMFSDLRSNRLALGAHDFGANIAPDLNWTSQRMSTWVQSLRKVCDDSRMKTRYPNWRDGMERFARAAWGRAATEEDKLAADDIATTTGSTAASQWRATCLALLSSTEMVTQ